MIKLPEQAFELLKARHKRQREQRIAMGDRWVDCDRLFTQDDGIPVHPDSITCWFHDFIPRTDLPQTSTTANIYSHAIRTADEKTAEVLEHIAKQVVTIVDFVAHRI